MPRPLCFALRGAVAAPSAERAIPSAASAAPCSSLSIRARCCAVRTPLHAFARWFRARRRGSGRG
eukprot:9043560-Pyramimonas_sp.AAC.1